MSYFFLCLYIKKRPWPLSLDQSVLLGKCSSPVLAIKQTELFFFWRCGAILLSFFFIRNEQGTCTYFASPFTYLSMDILSHLASFLHIFSSLSQKNL